MYARLIFFPKQSIKILAAKLERKRKTDMEKKSLSIVTHINNTVTVIIASMAYSHFFQELILWQKRQPSQAFALVYGNPDLADLGFCLLAS